MQRDREHVRSPHSRCCGERSAHWALQRYSARAHLTSKVSVQIVQYLDVLGGCLNRHHHDTDGVRCCGSDRTTPVPTSRSTRCQHTAAARLSAGLSEEVGLEVHSEQVQGYPDDRTASDMVGDKRIDPRKQRVDARGDRATGHGDRSNA